MNLTVRDCCVNMNKIHEQVKQDVFVKKITHKRHVPGVTESRSPGICSCQLKLTYPRNAHTKYEDCTMYQLQAKLKFADRLT